MFALIGVTFTGELPANDWLGVQAQGNILPILQCLEVSDVVAEVATGEDISDVILVLEVSLIDCQTVDLGVAGVNSCAKEWIIDAAFFRVGVLVSKLASVCGRFLAVADARSARAEFETGNWQPVRSVAIIGDKLLKFAREYICRLNSQLQRCDGACVFSHCADYILLVSSIKSFLTSAWNGPRWASIRSSVASSGTFRG